KIGQGIISYLSVLENITMNRLLVLTLIISILGLAMCLPPDTSPDDCECTPEYLDCSSDYEEYSNWDSHCTLENPNPHYEYKCCLPKWYFAPIPEYDPLEGKRMKR
uniref:Uncharacterized protein n=2 Tax=Magallana gigas TaxID=29159 RepID=A0A8W8K4U8_MAGGI